MLSLVDIDWPGLIYFFLRLTFGWLLALFARV